MPEFIDPVFAKTSLKRSFSVTANEHFGLIFAKTKSINSGTYIFRTCRSLFHCASMVQLIYLIIYVLTYKSYSGTSKSERKKVNIQIFFGNEKRELKYLWVAVYLP